MPDALTVREQILQVIEAELKAIQSIDGLVIARNEDIEYEVFPIINMLDAEATQRVVDRSTEVTVYELDLTIEGAVQATKPADIGPALSALYGVTVDAIKRAEGATKLIEQIGEQDMDASLVRDEEGVQPHAVMSLDSTIRFSAHEFNPYTAPA